MGGGQVMKRIPRIKFQQRQQNSKPSNSGLNSSSQIQAAATEDGDNLNISIPSSDVPTTPMNTDVGGKASLQPKRTPVSDREIEAILEELQAETERDDEERQIYNPLKLPMGWDGKPIPYWLYKLHGLAQEFKCEIFGNHSYWGRRAYERYFKKWLHQHGMRCLGIPNTKNFNEITSIVEAKQLWDKIQERHGVNKWRPELVIRAQFILGALCKKIKLRAFSHL